MCLKILKSTHPEDCHKYLQVEEVGVLRAESHVAATMMRAVRAATAAAKTVATSVLTKLAWSRILEARTYRYHHVNTCIRLVVFPNPFFLKIQNSHKFNCKNIYIVN